MPGMSKEDQSRVGQLTARPGQVQIESATGLQPLGLGAERDGFLYVPTSYSLARRAPLVVAFHGAGSNAQHGLRALQGIAERDGIILVIPDSRRKTWDVISGGYGPDVQFVDQALALVFERYAIDPAHIAANGFSDGASYALSLGLANGDLFTHVLAFSPGFMAPVVMTGRPHVFITHGTQDRVLPIDRCSRRIVPALRDGGYDVRYEEFDGPHTVPPELAQAGFEWFLGAALQLL